MGSTPDATGHRSRASSRAWRNTRNRDPEGDLMSDLKIETLHRVYAAFGRGDLDTILAALADDVDWISVSEAPNPVVPWYGRYRGKGEVPRFFNEIGSTVEVSEFTTLSFTANDTDVMVAIRWAFTVTATGQSAALHMQHWWRFTDGKIVFVRTCEDTAATAEAF